MPDGGIDDIGPPLGVLGGIIPILDPLIWFIGVPGTYGGLGVPYNI